MPGIELDRDDALRYVTAEAKKLKIANIELQQEIATKTTQLANANAQYQTATARVIELENLLEEATKPRTTIVPAGDPLAEDLSFLGYPTAAAK